MESKAELCSRALFEQAKRFIPGGVNSPVRAFAAVGGCPRFIRRAQGAYLWDVDGTQYLDYLCSWGAIILGHAHPQVVEAVTQATQKGTTYGCPTEEEVMLAELLCQAFPSLDQVRLTTSGTEAVMSALRLARGATGREKVVKFAGCYHGHLDSLLVKAGSGALTLGAPDSAGVPESFTRATLVLPYNDLAALEQCFAEYGQEIAAVAVEPVAGNMGVVPPQMAFLQKLRELTHEHGALLIFDEVITGFRLTFGGVQTIFDLQPDLTTLGKVIGGGLPIGAFGGTSEVMSHLAPLGDVYQAGTLSGNPVGVNAGLTTLKILQENPQFYTQLDSVAAELEQGIRQLATHHSVPLQLNRMGSMFSLFFTSEAVTDYDTAQTTDRSLYGRFFHHLLAEGIFLPPSPFESMFLTVVHTRSDIEKTLSAVDAAFKSS